MSASATPAEGVRAAFSAAIDYAGLFPPAALEMGSALAGYRRARRGAYAWMLGRFVVPASRVEELLLALRPARDEGALPVSAIVDAQADPRRWFETAGRALEDIARLRTDEGTFTVEALEVPLPALATKRETYDAAIAQFGMLAQRVGLRDVPAYVELPRDERWAELLPSAIFALQRSRLGAKIRCGGASAHAVPDAREVARFVHAAAGGRVPYKATAGLHHPYRHDDAGTGFAQHGFVNVLAAAALAAGGAGADELADVLEERDPTRLAVTPEGLRLRGHTIGADELAHIRRDGFVGWGSCSFEEPVDDLIALQVLERVAAP